MTISDFISVLIVVLCGGFVLGIILAQFILQKEFKKVLKRRQCLTCKHLEECAGCWKKSDEQNNCKIYQAKEPEETSEENQSLREIVKQTNREVLLLDKKIEEVADMVEETRDSLGEDISQVGKKVFDDGK